MTDALKSMAPIAAGRMWADGAPPQRGDWLLSHRYACYNVYETADGKYISVGALENRFWAALCRAFDVPRFADLQFDEQRRQEILDFFRAAFRKQTRDHWMEFFHGRDVCLAGVLTLDEALPFPGSNDAAAFGQVPPAVNLSHTTASVRSRPPRFGEHTRAILAELGYDEQQIDRMHQEGVV
jgi:crotonobetainyl-CoA:carnitine CoA-transferase CaiB-like acyl-CoA transferase